MTPDPLARLKVLLDSSTPIVAIETVEEVRAVRLVRAACTALDLAAFEWTIASGLVRCGSEVGEVVADPRESGSGHGAAYGAAAQQALANTKAIYNSQEPAQMLGNLEGISIGAAFILKDLHRHMDEPVVIRRLRDVGQKFTENRRTIILTSPKIEIPPELRGLVEFLELPLPDRRRLRQIVDEVVVRISKSHTLQRKLDAKGYDAVVESLRGLTEEESERALSQALVARYALCPEIAGDVVEAKKALLRRSEMLEFVEASETFSSVGGMENLKRWLAQRRGSWGDAARGFGLEPPHGVIILGVQGCGKSLCARTIAGEWNLPLVKSIPQPSTTNTLARPKSEFARSSRLPKDLLHACSGSMSWKKYSPAAAPIQPRPMPEFRPACWPRFFLGCRIARRPCSWPPPATL
jgi:hypothetical protein